MSHFTVLVIGHGVDAQLAPYHEFECTGRDDQYVQDVDITPDAHAAFAKHGSGSSFADFCVEYYGYPKVLPNDPPGKFGYIQVDGHGHVIKVVQHTNPNAKWDWYVVGGRWTGFFKLKPAAVGALGQPGLQVMSPGYVPPTPDRADIAHKRDINFEGMRLDAVADAAADYDRFRALTDGLPPIVTWSAMQTRHCKLDGKVDYDAARRAYHAQPMVAALRNNRETAWWNADEFLVSRDVYVERARHGAVAPFAMVQDGQWYEQGRMGWWGISQDDMDPAQWNHQVSTRLDQLSDDTLLTLVDCHI